MAKCQHSGSQQLVSSPEVDFFSLQGLSYASMESSRACKSIASDEVVTDYVSADVNASSVDVPDVNDPVSHFK